MCTCIVYIHKQYCLAMFLENTMKTIIMLVVVAFATVKGIAMVTDNTSNVIVNHNIATQNAIDEATR